MERESRRTDKIIRKVSIFSCLLLLLSGFCASSYRIYRSAVISNYYKQGKLISHALGGFKKDGKSIVYTNTLEAFSNSRKKGSKLFELDLMLTSDKKVVAFHNYSKSVYKKLKVKNQTFTYDEFMSGKVFKNTKLEGLTPIDLKMFIDLVRKHPDTFWMPHFYFPPCADAKNTEEILKQFMKEIGNEKELLKRMTFGVNIKEELPILKKFNLPVIHGLVEEPIKQFNSVKANEDVLGFLLKNNIKAVSIPTRVAIKEPDLLRQLKQNKIKIYSFTVDSFTFAKKLFKLGVDVVGTNNL